MYMFPLNQQDIRELQKQCLHHNIFPIDLSSCTFSQRPEPVYRLQCSELTVILTLENG